MSNTLTTPEQLARVLQRVETERRVYRQALGEIQETQGQVCGEFETCRHPACRSSYSSWQIADSALRRVTELVLPGRITRPAGEPEYFGQTLTGVERILDERWRQIEKGFTPEHDKGHTPSQLVAAGAAYLYLCLGNIQAAYNLWPWKETGRITITYQDDGTTLDGLRHLEKAGALVAAAIDRELDRRNQPRSLEAIARDIASSAVYDAPSTEGGMPHVDKGLIDELIRSVKGIPNGS